MNLLLFRTRTDLFNLVNNKRQAEVPNQYRRSSETYLLILPIKPFSFAKFLNTSEVFRDAGSIIIS